MEHAIKLEITYLSYYYKTIINLIRDIDPSDFQSAENTSENMYRRFVMSLYAEHFEGGKIKSIKDSELADSVLNLVNYRFRNKMSTPEISIDEAMVIAYGIKRYIRDYNIKNYSNLEDHPDVFMFDNILNKILNPAQFKEFQFEMFNEPIIYMIFSEMLFENLKLDKFIQLVSGFDHLFSNYLHYHFLDFEDFSVDEEKIKELAKGLRRLTQMDVISSMSSIKEFQIFKLVDSIFCEVNPDPFIIIEDLSSMSYRSEMYYEQEVLSLIVRMKVVENKKSFEETIQEVRILHMHDSDKYNDKYTRIGNLIWERIYE